MRGALSSGCAGGGRGGRGGDQGHPCRGHSERDVQDGAVSLSVVLGLPPAASTTAPRSIPAIGSLGPVDGRRALAPAAAHADPNGGLLIRPSIVAAGGLLGHPGAAPEGRGLPGAGLEADLDLSEPRLAHGGSTQQARAAHRDRQNKAVQPGAGRGAWHSTSLLLSVLWLSVLLSRSLWCSAPLSLPPSLPSH